MFGVASTILEPTPVNASTHKTKFKPKSKSGNGLTISCNSLIPLQPVSVFKLLSTLAQID